VLLSLPRRGDTPHENDEKNKAWDKNSQDPRVGDPRVGALRLQDSKAVSQLLGFRIYAAPLPSPPQLFTAEYRDPEQLQGASSIRAVICHRLLPSAL